MYGFVPAAGWETLRGVKGDEKPLKHYEKFVRKINSKVAGRTASAKHTGFAVGNSNGLIMTLV